MPPALPPWPAPDAPAAAPGPTTRPPAAPPSRAGPPPRRAPAPPPSTPRPCDWSTARRRAAAPPGGPAACRAAPASGSSASSRCAVAGRRARPGPRRCTAPAASRPTAPRTRSSRPPRPPRDPSPAARSPGRAGPSGRPPRRGTALPAPPRSSVPPPPPRVRLPQAEAQPTGCVTPQEPSTERISRKSYEPLTGGAARPQRCRSTAPVTGVIPMPVTRLKTRRDAGERATLEAAWRLLQGVGASPALDRIAALVGRELAARAGWSFVMVDPMAYAEVVAHLRRRSDRPLVAMELFTRLFSYLPPDGNEVLASRVELARVAGC